MEAPAQETRSPRPEGAAPVRTYLTIQGVQFDQAPGGLFDVFLQGAGGRREQVGVINFFNMRPSGSGEHAGHHAHGVTRANFRFDVTNAVRELGLSADAPPSIVFQSTDGLTGSTAEGVARQMNAAANVRFESAQLVGGP